MPGQNLKIIIDTNLWISFLLTKNLSQLDKIIANQKLTLVFSEELLSEFLEVTRQKKFSKYFATADVDNLLVKINSRAVFIKVTSNIVACRDPKDNFLLSLAIDGKITHLITGDKDLLELKKIADTKILTVNEYVTEA